MASKESELEEAKAQLTSQQAEGAKEIGDAKVKIAENEQKFEEFENEKADIEKKIAENEESLEEVQERADNLSVPANSVNTRREMLGSEGYRIYDSASDIIDSQANTFPIFLYFVAALVTSTTMTRFVDEEKTNSGH